MKRLIVLLVVSMLLAGTAFATVATGSQYSIGAPAPKSSINLNGIAKANFEYDLDAGEGRFLKEGKLAHVDLSAVKTVTKGNGGLIGTGDIYGAVSATFDLSVDLDYSLPTDPDNTSPYIVNVYQNDKKWNSTIKNFANSLSLTSEFEFTEFYVAKEGYWKLDLMKSDASLDYAVSAVDTYKLLYNNRIYYFDGIKTFGVTKSVNVDENTGVTLTFEDSPIYLQKVSVGYDVDKYNILIESMPIVFDGGYTKLGAVFGTVSDGTNLTKNGGVSLQARYAQKAFRFVVASDLMMTDIGGENKFDADAAVKVETMGITIDGYYATKAETKLYSKYGTYANGYAATAWKNLISAAVSYSFDIDDFNITARVLGRNLKFKKILGASVVASNGKLGIEAYFDYTVSNKAYEIDGIVSYQFEKFGVSAEADYASTSKNIAIEVVASSDVIVGGAVVSLTYETDDIKTTKGAITASIAIEF